MWKGEGGWRRITREKRSLYTSISKAILHLCCFYFQFLKLRPLKPPIAKLVLDACFMQGDMG